MLLLQLLLLLICHAGNGSGGNWAIAVCAAVTMNSCSAGHASLFAATRNEFGEEVFRLVECFQYAWAKLRMPWTIHPQHIVIRTPTIKRPIKSHHRTEAGNGPFHNPIHVPQRHIPRDGNAARLGRVSHHTQIPRCLVSDPPALCHVGHLDHHDAKFHVGRGVDEAVDGGSRAVAPPQHGLDDFDAVRAGDAIDGHAELKVGLARARIGGGHDEGRDAGIAILGRVDVGEVGRLGIFVGGAPVGQLCGRGAHVLDEAWEVDLGGVARVLHLQGPGSIARVIGEAGPASQVGHSP
mmetsp:Transcript_7606/g.13419  ORF Transcript_7606/g.13419 Transcript_7606/m.13419 type:complete len:294 (-) Transcript_7606:1144-2025(-)